MVEQVCDIGAPIINGILLGGLYTIIALGLSLVFGVMRLINMAHGDLVIFGAYFAYTLLSAFGVDPILSLVLGIPLLFFIGYLIQKYLMDRVFNISLESPLIIAFGFSLVLENAFQLIFSPLSRGLTTSYAFESITLGEICVPVVYLFNIAVALIVMSALSLFLRKTYIGQAIIASSQDVTAAQLLGINTSRIFAITFGISGAIAAIAGVFLGLTFPFTPVSGIPFLIIAFGVVILGGLGSIRGTFIGGLILGVVQTISAEVFGASAQMLAIYIIVLVLLTVRPQGLFGR